MPDEGCKGAPVPGIKYVFGARGARGRVRAAEPRTHAAGAGRGGRRGPAPRLDAAARAPRAVCVRCASTTPLRCANAEPESGEAHYTKGIVDCTQDIQRAPGRTPQIN